MTSKRVIFFLILGAVFALTFFYIGPRWSDAKRAEVPLSPASTAPSKSEPTQAKANSFGAAAPLDVRAPRTGEGRGLHVIHVDVPVPNEQTGRRISMLEAELKSGNSQNAYELFALLERCNKAAANVAALKDLQSKGERIDTAYLEQQGVLTASCKDVTPGQLSRASEILDLAAASGDVRAQTLYVNNPPQALRENNGLIKHPEKVAEFKAKAVNYLHAAADAGSVMAMAQLAGAYRDGILVPQDRVSAYAYYLASISLNPTQKTPVVIDAYEAGLSPAQLQRADEMHKEILARARR